MKCQHDNCTNEGNECILPDGTKQYYCPDHSYENGFCRFCGGFFGGEESFEFNNPSKLCEFCLDNIKTELGEFDESEDLGPEDFIYDDHEDYSCKDE